MGELGVRSDVIERCLNHVGDDRLRKIYQRQELIPERIAAFRKLGERLQQLVAESAPKVVPGKRDSIPPPASKISSVGRQMPLLSDSRSANRNTPDGALD